MSEDNQVLANWRKEKQRRKEEEKERENKEDQLKRERKQRSENMVGIVSDLIGLALIYGSIYVADRWFTGHGYIFGFVLLAFYLDKKFKYQRYKLEEIDNRLVDIQMK